MDKNLFNWLNDLDLTYYLLMRGEYLPASSSEFCATPSGTSQPLAFRWSEGIGACPSEYACCGTNSNPFLFYKIKVCLENFTTLISQFMLVKQNNDDMVPPTPKEYKGDCAKLEGFVSERQTAS